MECPPGHYCPAGSTLETMIPCPAGTFRLTTRGSSVDSCFKCPEGSSNALEGSTICVLCGRGSTNSEDSKTCKCVGAFRTWQGSTN